MIPQRAHAGGKRGMKIARRGKTLWNMQGVEFVPLNDAGSSNILAHNSSNGVSKNWVDQVETSGQDFC